jgi:hypothetical protein
MKALNCLLSRLIDKITIKHSYIYCNLFIGRFVIILFRDGINQILVGISINPMAILVQFKGRLLISVGSKIENRFLITFN